MESYMSPRIPTGPLHQHRGKDAKDIDDQTLIFADVEK